MERKLTSEWRQIQLTEHFKLGEFVVSASHPALAEAIFPTPDQADRCLYLARFALEPIRKKFGPTYITRGLASPELNEAQGGVSGSQHLDGSAVDFECKGQDMNEVFEWCRDWLPWKGELIYYYNRHVHLALPSLFVKPDQFIKKEI